MVSRSAVGPASCTLRALLAVVLGVAGVAASSAALAHGRFYGPRVGVYIGGPVWPRYYYGPAYYPYAYPYPYYYPPAPVVAVPSAPPQYVERSDAPPPAASALEPGYWYYCRNPQGYYPSVAQCPGGWEKVAPQPPSN